MIVFDVDGTIVDTKDGIVGAIDYVLSKDNRGRIDNDYKKYIGPPISESLMKYHGYTEEEADVSTALYRKIYVEKYIERTTRYADLELVLDALSEEHKLAIATMKTMPQVKRLFDLFDIEKYFTTVQAASESCKRSKSEMLRCIKQDCPNEKEYYMVGDTIGDYLAAQSEGYEFIFAEYGYGDNKDMDKCDYIIRSMRDLFDILEK